MLGPFFFAVEVACEHLNKMLDAAKIRVEDAPGLVET